jgi:hypothetical protein
LISHILLFLCKSLVKLENVGLLKNKNVHLFRNGESILLQLDIDRVFNK